MEWLSAKNTIKVTNKIKKDLKNIMKIGDFLIQIVLCIYYGVYSVLVLDRFVNHVIYSCFFMIGFILLVYLFIALFRKVEKQYTRAVKRVVRLVKTTARFFLLGLSYYEISTTEVTLLKMLLTILSTVLILLQIIYHLVIELITNYIEMYQESLKMDYEDSRLIRAAVNSYKAPQNKPAGLIGAFAKKIVTSKIEDFIDENVDSVELKEPTEHEQKIRDKINSL